ncbi:MAG: OmpH family outer membrane protein [Synergistaceae bacterium]
MKKIITLLLVTFLVAFFASCSFAAEDKVGYVDDVAILREFPKFKKAQEQLEALSKTKADKAKANFDKETDDKKKAQIVQDLQLEMRNEETKIMKPVLTEVNETISKVAKAKGITVVLNKVLVYYGGIDLTQDVITALKR